jgi:hypothetical protein
MLLMEIDPLMYLVQRNNDNRFRFGNDFQPLPDGSFHIHLLVHECAIQLIVQYERIL